MQQFQTLSCVHYTFFLSSKIRFIQTSTVTGSHSCSGRNYAYALRTSCFLLTMLTMVMVTVTTTISITSYNGKENIMAYISLGCKHFYHNQVQNSPKNPTVPISFTLSKRTFTYGNIES